MPEVAGVEDAAVVLVAEVVGATDEVAGIDDVADAEEVAVALVVVIAGDELVVIEVLVVLLPFPPHPIRSAATITRVKEIPKIFFKFHPSYPAFGFPAGNWGHRGQDIVTPLGTKSTSPELNN